MFFFQYHPLLHFQCYGMLLHCCTFSCVSTHSSCYATVRSYELPRIRDATPLYVLLHFHTYVMLRHWYTMLHCCRFLCACKDTSCYATCTFSRTSTHTSCYARVGSLALPMIGHATLLYVFFALPRRPHATSLYVLLRFERYIMLQHM